MKNIIELTKMYSELHRHYHTLFHIVEMFDIARHHNVELTEEQILAIWWHDAVYNPQSSTNEEDSVNAFKSRYYPSEKENIIESIIMSTKTHKPTTYDEAIVCDLDMMILSSSPARYAHYVEQLRKEYSHLTPQQFDRGRFKFLESVLESNIFHTDTFAPYESKARTNVITEMTALKDRI